MKLTQMIAEYVEKKEKYEAKEEKINALVAKREKQLKWAKDRLSNLKYPYWIKEIIEPIAKEMVKQMSDRYYEILGPFGMDANTSIHFYKKSIPEEEKLNGGNCISITFTPKNLEKGELGLKDYSINTHRYGEGSMGDMNGMNYPTVPLKDSIGELMIWMGQQNAKKETKK